MAQERIAKRLVTLREMQAGGGESFVGSSLGLPAGLGDHVGEVRPRTHAAAELPHPIVDGVLGLLGVVAVGKAHVDVGRVLFDLYYLFMV